MNRLLRISSSERGRVKLGLAIAFASAIAGLVAVSVTIFGNSDRDVALAEHQGAGGHGIQLDCIPDPFVAGKGTQVTVTYIVRNAAGVPGNNPDHDVTYTLVDTWVGDIVDPAVGGTEPDTDSLQHHQSAVATTFAEDVDQQTYARSFTVAQVLLNTVTLTGTFDDGHQASALIQCNIEHPTPTPTNTPTNTPTHTPTNTNTPTNTPTRTPTLVPTNTPVGGEGCTPGYWKQPQHFGNWTSPYDPTDLFSAHFENAFPGMTLLQVLSQGGGGLNALGRHTVAALLNAASPDVDYAFSAQDVINQFNAVFPGTNAQYETLKNTFAGENERGCPLARAEAAD